MEKLLCYRTADGQIHHSFQDAKRHVQKKFDDLVDQLCIDLVRMLKDSSEYLPEPNLVRQLLKEVPESALHPETINKLSSILMGLNLSKVMTGKRPLHYWMIDRLTDFRTLIELQEDLSISVDDDTEHYED